MYIDLKRVEFIVTYQCSGKCKHCSIGDAVKNDMGEHIQYSKMKDVLTKLSKRFSIESVMCFGGEPLLYSSDVCKIMQEAKQCDIPNRQIITNGYFSKSESKIADVILLLEEAGTTQILLSIDSFHQETIPIEPVYFFAKKVLEGGVIEIKAHPAWVIDKENDNVWNCRTGEILRLFDNLNLSISNGNNIFPAGNAIQYLLEYFPKKEIDLNIKCGNAAYTNALDEIDTISITPDGKVWICGFSIGNIYEENILEIIDRYNPNENKVMKILLNEGVKGLIEYGETLGVTIDLNKHYSACSICREVVAKLQ